jgi:hypothetical protein
MSAEDALLALQRYSTSKIEDERDLFAIRTFGFRGEALSAIAAVSKMKVVTRKDGELAGVELKVEGLITGSVLRSGDRVRVTAQLIDPASGTQLWARSYERSLRDVLSLQNEIVSAITREVKGAADGAGGYAPGQRAPSRSGSL